jgi:hypothetical protein
MTQREAIVQALREWRKRAAGFWYPYPYRTCPLCRYSLEHESLNGCDVCPLVVIRGKHCIDYACYRGFSKAYLTALKQFKQQGFASEDVRRDAQNRSKRYARAFVRVLEGLMLSQGWKVPKR